MIQQPIAPRHPLPKCDCLNWCGDDPRLKDQRVIECDKHRTRRLEIARAERIGQLLRELGYSDVLPALEALHLIVGQARQARSTAP